MPLLSILASKTSFKWTGGAVLTFDASIEEQHSKAATLTDHPIEDGSDVTDHVRQQPDSIRMVGEISNHPLSRILTVNTGPDGSQRFGVINTGDDPRDRVTVAWTQLIYLIENAIPVTIVTTLWTYEDMVITSIDVPRNAKLGNTLHFTALLRHISFVKSATVDAPATTVTTAKPPVPKGKQVTKPATEEQSTFAGNIYKSIVGK